MALNSTKLHRPPTANTRHQSVVLLIRSRCSIALCLVSDDLLPAQRPDAQFGDELLQLALLEIIDGVLLPSIHQLVGFIQTGQEDVVGLKVNMREDQTKNRLDLDKLRLSGTVT
ncbi:hypothetical protein INR49_017987 [Caranx melampygus]|nr:hypothetical protein INR49_017987 [Caranx melampygus]